MAPGKLRILYYFWGIYMYVYIYIYTYLFVHVCIYIYIYIHKSCIHTCVVYQSPGDSTDFWTHPQLGVEDSVVAMVSELRSKELQRNQMQLQVEHDKQMTLGHPGPVGKLSAWQRGQKEV